MNDTFVKKVLADSMLYRKCPDVEANLLPWGLFGGLTRSLSPMNANLHLRLCNLPDNSTSTSLLLHRGKRRRSSNGCQLLKIPAGSNRESNQQRKPSRSRRNLVCQPGSRSNL